MHCSADSFFHSIMPMLRLLSSLLLCLVTTMSFAQTVVKDYENGDHYEGTMRDGLRHGKFTCRMSSATTVCWTRMQNRL